MTPGRAAASSRPGGQQRLPLDSSREVLPLAGQARPPGQELPRGWVCRHPPPRSACTDLNYKGLSMRGHSRQHRAVRVWVLSSAFGAHDLVLRKILKADFFEISTVPLENSSLAEKAPNTDL